MTVMTGLAPGMTEWSGLNPRTGTTLGHPNLSQKGEISTIRKRYMLSLCVTAHARTNTPHRCWVRRSAPSGWTPWDHWDRTLGDLRRTCAPRRQHRQGWRASKGSAFPVAFLDVLFNKRPEQKPGGPANLVKPHRQVHDHGWKSNTLDSSKKRKMALKWIYGQGGFYWGTGKDLGGSENKWHPSVCMCQCVLHVCGCSKPWISFLYLFLPFLWLPRVHISYIQ